MSEDPYVYPGTVVLQNKLGIRDGAELDYVEREYVVQRLSHGVPQGEFDLSHLCRIHHHLFQDVYAWAGQIRTVEISKGRSQFQFRQYIATGMADIHRRLVRSDYLMNLPERTFAAEAAVIIGDVNYVHPFREGNGRTQLVYLSQLAARAGHRLTVGRLDRAAWTRASQDAHQGRYDTMADCIAEALGRRRARDP